MLALLANSVGYGGYISPIKFVVMIILFYAWIPLVTWVYSDTHAVRANVNFWTSAITAVGAATIVVWLLAPMFIIGLLIYLIAVGATIFAYILHRNSKVADFEKVLTASHIKGLFVNEGKKIEASSKGIVLVTANNNDVPIPAPKTPEAFGFKSVCQVFNDALWRRAGDVILQPGQQEYNIAYNIDGVTIKQPSRSREEIEYFLHYLKQLADLDVQERRKPQKGTFKTIKDSARIEWEVNTAGSTAGEQAIVQRVEEYSLMKIDDLGFTPEQLEKLKQLKNIEKGLFIISGPEKSGITSTFYSILRSHDPFMNNINTLEKKPAGELTNITQNIFKMSDSGTASYVTRLQSILRMGPDIMGIAQCQEPQLASLANIAAKDGKVVHVTIEASSVLKALAKWLKLVPDKNLVADNLIGILNQRLVRKLCTKCRQAYQPNPDLLKKLNIPADKIKLLYRPGEIEYTRRGKPILCENCQGTGFYGRTGIFEMIIIDDKLRAKIKQAKTMQEIAGSFRQAGMLYMQEQSIKKAADGTTSINEIIREFSSSQPKPKTKNKQESS